MGALDALIVLEASGLVEGAIAALAALPVFGVEDGARVVSTRPPPSSGGALFLWLVGCCPCGGRQGG